MFINMIGYGNRISIKSKKSLCLSVCLYVLCSICTATVLSASARIWQVSFLYPDHGRLASAAQTCELALSAPELAGATDRALSGNSELVASNHN